jgi:ABC-type transport system involved in Fe-S cluster assembly, permease component
LWNS